jgi:cardiolipin synthase
MMTTPCFVPDESLLTGLLSAVQRGVDVAIIVPARNDSLPARQARVTHFDDLMSAGVRIALLRGGLLHSKSLTIGGEVSLNGSVNLDMHSFWLNFKISLGTHDRSFSEELLRLQANCLSASGLLDLGWWRHRPPWRKSV